MKFGVYSIVVPEYRADAAAAKVAEAGYTGIEWTVGYPKAVWDPEAEWHVSMANLEADAKRVAEIARENDLDIPALGTRCESHEFDKLRSLMDAALTMNCPVVRVASHRYDGTEDYNALFAKVKRNYETVEKIAREKGVRAAIEIHGRTIAPSASAMRRLLEGFDPQCICATLDPGNMIYEGMENWQMGIEILGEYLGHAHAKNYGWEKADDGKWKTMPTALDEGIADWKAILRALAKVGYDGYINLEDFRGGYCKKAEGITTEEKLAQAISFFTSALDEIKAEG